MGELSNDIKTHDLIKLLELAQLPNRLEELPNQLTHFIIWQARYPVPNKFNNNTFQGQSNYLFDLPKADLPWCVPSDKEDIDSFYKWLWEQQPSN
jgi:hypothetical protein